jgi:hypothetical protein
MDDPEGGGAWLTKAELAATRGITLASATRMIRRQGWRRQTGNDGRVRVFVPLGQSDPRPQVRPEGNPKGTPENGSEGAPGATPGADLSLSEAFTAALAEVREAHASEVATMRDQLGRERERADQAEVAVADLRLRIEDVTARLDEAEARAERALLAAKDSLVAAEEAQMARAEAEADVADLRERQARELAVAEHDARAAQQAAAELRQAEERRRGQGRWARLRAAWRGE